MDTEKTSSAEQFERYCAAVVTALREELYFIDGDVDHEAWCPEEGDQGEPRRMSFEVMYTNPETHVSYILWTPTSGWVYKLDDQSPGEPGHLMNIGEDEDPGYVAYVACMLIEQHVDPAYPVPQLREQIETRDDDDPTVRAVNNVLHLHRPHLVRGLWSCSECADGHTQIYPCSTIGALIRGFNLDIL